MRRRVILPMAALAVLLAAATTAFAQYDWLSLCGKCLSPSITSKSGIGTAKAMAEGRITRRDAEEWCANWQPGGDLQACVREQLASEDARRTYRATADCAAGRITAIDGQTYTLAGRWTSDVGKGRTRWRDARGQIVGQDNASNGLAISQQWEVLCPEGRSKSTPPAGTAAVAPKGPPSNAAPAAPAAVVPFAVGQVVEALYGRQWLRGRITRIRQTSGPRGREISYDVILDNGQRGVLPARMLRRPAAR